MSYPKEASYIDENGRSLNTQLTEHKKRREKMISAILLLNTSRFKQQPSQRWDSKKHIYIFWRLLLRQERIKGTEKVSPIHTLFPYSVFASIVHARLENIYHKYVFAYRKHCGCDTAILSLTERWKQELDNNKVPYLFD